MKEAEKSVLEAWHLIEALSPHNLPNNKELEGEKFKDNQKKMTMREFDVESADGEQLFQSVELKKASYYYIYYCDCYKQYQLVEALRKLFNIEDELVNKLRQESYSFSFSVDQTGKYIKDSLVVPFIMYVMKEIKGKDQINYRYLEERFKSALDSLELRAQEILLNGITKSSVKKLQDEYIRYFYRVKNEEGGEEEEKLKNYRELNLVFFEKAKNGNENRKPLPNFYMGDLQKILSEDSINQTLLTYISGMNFEQRTHIDENRTYIEGMLQPTNLPSARWPSPVKHRLSLMQQVAVNQFFVENQDVSSVNGPPGTGKTTLLKDIFANVVVERSRELAKLESPYKMFDDTVESVKLGDYSYPITKLNPAISSFSMVVASSNNGAVENISKDLPKKNEVIRDDSSEFDQRYAEEAKVLDLFPDLSSMLISGDEKVDTWGLFSVPLGKAKNIDKFAQHMFASKKENKKLDEDKKTLSAHLLQYKKSEVEKEWHSAVEEFNELSRQIESKKLHLQKIYEESNKVPVMTNKLMNFKESITNYESQLKDADKDKEELSKKRGIVDEQISLLPKRSFISRLFTKDEREMSLKEELFHILDALKEREAETTKVRNKKNQFITEVKNLEEELAKYDQLIKQYASESLIIPNEQYWNDDEEAYARRQINTPWVTDSLNYDRGLLFLKAMKLHKLALVCNADKINAAMRLLRFRNGLDLSNPEHRKVKKEVLKTVHLITPLVSTTFASFSAMYEGVGEDFIEYLFIDEAGQATPQQAAGAIWRSKRVLAVGDPLQVEPVVTIDQTIMSDVRKYYGVSEEHVGMSASVQSLADQANSRGMNTTETAWMGIPLWVHRRCSNPMFSIANEIAYGNKMVLASESSINTDNCKWYDCKGSVTKRQFVKEQGELLVHLLLNQKNEKGEVPNHYVITPFSAVKEELTKMLKNKGFSIEWIKQSVGTVHTFQGKEADIVYFVVGTDKNTKSSAEWSCKQPNLINVAVTRAKKEFHIIGDYSLLSPMKNYATIAKHAKVIHPQKV
ncbi:ATP-binding protein [Exiguobacterium sp. SRB7LM]|uniref:DEAD/DEAH box helicase n=1 Tax=Exiguobacterium sp. SRB7LM TaxID=2608401 RepID=UPI0018C3A687|nr:DNA helicase [Exiguobacterium sp. SRB7LM]